jgi:membrane associated rhomboid family serine protease
MGLGFLTGFAGLVWYVLAVPFGYLSYLFLHYELGVINFFANLPFASITFPNFPLFLTILIYAYFAYKLFGGNTSPKVSPRGSLGDTLGINSTARF